MTSLRQKIPDECSSDFIELPNVQRPLQQNLPTTQPIGPVGDSRGGGQGNTDSDEDNSRSQVYDTRIKSTEPKPAVHVTVHVVEKGTQRSAEEHYYREGGATANPLPSQTAEKTDLSQPGNPELASDETKTQNNNSDNHDDPELGDDDLLLLRSTTRSLQFAMTLLFALMVPAALLSLWFAPRYRLLIFMFWVVLWLLFMSLISFLQHVTRNPTVLHPMIHRLARMVVREYRNFVSDWKTEMLLLTYYNDSDMNENIDATSNNNNNDAEEASRERGHRPKSRIFKAVVQPFLPWLARRKQKKKERKEKQQRRSRAEAEYVPPDYQLV